MLQHCKQENCLFLVMHYVFYSILLMRWIFPWTKYLYYFSLQCEGINLEKAALGYAQEVLTGYAGFDHLRLVFQETPGAYWNIFYFVINLLRDKYSCDLFRSFAERVLKKPNYLI